MQKDTLNTLSINGDTLLWKESSISVNEVLGGTRDALLSPLDIVSEVVIVLLILTLFIFYYGRIFEGIIISFRAVINERRVIAIENSALLYNAKNTMLAFVILTLSFVVAAYHRELFNFLPYSSIGLSYLFILGAVYLYLTYRYIVSQLFNFITKNSIFILLNKYFLTYFAVILLLLPIWFVLDRFIEENADSLVYTSLIVIALFVYFLHVIRSYKLIIKGEFSYLFYILYLCTLEILPMVLLLSLISN